MNELESKNFTTLGSHLLQRFNQQNLFISVFICLKIKLLTENIARTPPDLDYIIIIIMLFRCFDLKFLNIYALFHRIFRRIEQLSIVYNLIFLTHTHTHSRVEYLVAWRLKPIYFFFLFI